MKTARTAYQSYLLRLWCEDEKGAWRATLEDVATRESHNFPNMAALYAFLNCKTLPLDGNLTIKEWAQHNSTETLTPAFYQYIEEEVE